jgi:hypothetical protein
MKKIIPLIIVLALFIPIKASAAPSQATIPSSKIVNVVEDSEVTIKVYNFPANDTLTVRMGLFGTRGVGGIVVATQDSGATGTFTATYTIPASLHDEDLIAIRLQSPSTGYYAYDWFWNSDGNKPISSSSPSPLPAGTIPTFSITNVNKDTDITISPKNFPPNDTFKVRMGAFGTRGVGGEIVETVTTDANGNLSDKKYAIPASLAGSYKIAIRLQSPTSGYYSYNWFYNNTSAGSSSSGTLPAGTYPTFSIDSVVTDTSVKIVPYNFPSNDTFKVRMGAFGTRGVGGEVVATVTTDANGNLSSLKYSIPASFAGSYKIAIRLVSPTSGYYAYNWFYNDTTSSSSSSSSILPVGTYPTFSISSVVKNSKVTINPKNFSPNDTYKVRMGAFGTAGVGGEVVATVTTDANGNLSSKTYNVPTSLVGSYQIAIRLESPSSGYYAYNWFYNKDAP